MPGVEEAALAEAAQIASLADETPEGRSIVVLAKQYGHPRAPLRPVGALRAVLRRDAHERRGPRRLPAAQGRRRRDHQLRRGARAGRRRPSSRRPSTGSPARAARRWPWRATPRCSASSTSRTWSRRACSHRFDQLRAMGIRTVMVTGDNPLTAAKIADESGRGRLPRRGHPRAQARADPRGAARGPARRDDGRRHQRRSGARPGRRGRGHEHRHPGGARGGQHGRPRLQPDEADRDRRDRQAAADHPRRAHHLLGGQRRGQVLRDPAGDLRGHLRRGGRDQRAARASSTSWTWARPSRRSSPRSSSTR